MTEIINSDNRFDPTESLFLQIMFAPNMSVEYEPDRFIFTTPEKQIIMISPDKAEVTIANATSQIHHLSEVVMFPSIEGVVIQENTTVNNFKKEMTTIIILDDGKIFVYFSA